MTIRDIAVAFGFVVDRDSERQAESSIKKVKNLAVKLLGTIGIGLSIAGISGLADGQRVYTRHNKGAETTVKTYPKG